MAIISLICAQCRKKFYRDSKHVRENEKLGHRSYCSPSCLSAQRKLSKKLICENPKCGKLFERRISGISAHNYCSRSCSVSINNTKFPKNPGVRKVCAFCQKIFISREKYCSVACKRQNQTIPAEKILEQIKLFYQAHKRIPLKREFAHTKAARDRFGSWNKAIIAAGFKPNPVMFANKHIAKDGHKCDSLAEKIIDDWLYKQNIEHKRSIPYPGNPTLTADFVIGKYWIEFFGLHGELRRYDELRNEKLQLAQEYQLNLIEVYPHNLFPKNNLSTILQFE